MVVKLKSNFIPIFSDFSIFLPPHYILLKWSLFPVISSTRYPNSRSPLLFHQFLTQALVVQTERHLGDLSSMASLPAQKGRNPSGSTFPSYPRGQRPTLPESLLRSTCSIMYGRRKFISSLSRKDYHLKAQQVTVQYPGI